MKDEKAKTISEDERFKFLEELDKAVSVANDKVEKLAKEKEADVMVI